MADPKQSVKEAWLSVLGVFNSAEAEVNKATHKLLESLGLQPDENGEHHLAAEFVARMKRNREDIEKKIEEGVKTAVARVRAPIDKEISALKARLEHLQTRFEEVQKRGKKKKDV